MTTVKKVPKVNKKRSHPAPSRLKTSEHAGGLFGCSDVRGWVGRIGVEDVGGVESDRLLMVFEECLEECPEECFVE
jgi:hypothetical protein